jgi:hypothetical protein
MLPIASPKVDDCEVLRDGANMFVLVGGVKIAQRKRPGHWITLVPNWFVRDHRDQCVEGIIVEYHRVRGDVAHGYGWVIGL